MVDKVNRERLDRISVQMRKLIDTSKAEKRDFTAEERTTWNKMREDYESIEFMVKANETVDGIENDLRTVPKDKLIAEYGVADPDRQQKDFHAKGFTTYLRKGLDGFRNDQVDPKLNEFMASKWVMNITSDKSPGVPLQVFNTMSTTAGTQGGFIIPTGFSGMLEEAKKWFGGIKGTVETFQTSTGNPFPWPTVNDINNRGRIIGQNVQVTETDLVFGQVTFNAYIASSDVVLVPLALMEDSYFNLDALVARLLGVRLGRLYNYECTVGSGSSAPTGIVTAIAAAGLTYQLPTGNTASVSYTNLVTVEHSVDPDYRFQPSTYWMFSDSMLKLLKLLVDGNSRPLWQPGLTASFREGGAVDLLAAKPTILDHPLEEEYLLAA
jgi:HK97 family phage major capsid protein